MDPFRSLRAAAAPSLRANVDTEAITPSREMKSVSKTGLADGLFAGWRYTAIGGREPNPEFVLNQPAYVGTKILLGGENFGCGSSREHAVWALHEYGIRVVIAPSFSPIFRGNCVRNGIVPVTLAAEEVAKLAEFVMADPSVHQLEVDLEVCEVRAGANIQRFELESEAREMLLEGLHGIDLTLKHRADIDAFVARDRLQRPWIYSTVEKARA